MSDNKIVIIGDASINNNIEHYLKEEGINSAVVVYEPKGKPEGYNVDEAFTVIQSANKEMGRDLMLSEAALINALVKRDSLRIMVQDGLLKCELVYPELEPKGSLRPENPTLLTDEEKAIITAAGENHRGRVHNTLEAISNLRTQIEMSKPTGKEARRARRSKERKNKK